MILPGVHNITEAGTKEDKQTSKYCIFLFFYYFIFEYDYLIFDSNNEVPTVL